MTQQGEALVNDLLAVAVTNCGNLKSGSIIIYTR